MAKESDDVTKSLRKDVKQHAKKDSKAGLWRSRRSGKEVSW